MPHKKSFDLSDNPAMRFISPAGERLEPPQRDAAPASSVSPPLLGRPPEGFKYDSHLIETKSRKVNSLIRPSLYDALKSMSAETGESVNEHLNKAIEAYIYAHTHMGMRIDA